jgi:hypothetical protein
MPVSSTPDLGGPEWQLSFSGPDGTSFDVRISAPIATETQGDAAIQSLVNHLSDWPDLVALSSYKGIANNYPITPDS